MNLSKTSDKRLFQALKNEVTQLHSYWIIYRQLYGTSKRRVEILNRSGGFVFHILQKLMLDEITLALCRLTDPSHTSAKGKKVAQLSLRLLLKRVDGRRNPELNKILTRSIKEITNLIKPHRARRNRLIAHRDFALAENLRVDSLTVESRKAIEEALRLIRDWMNAYQTAAVDGGVTLYEETILEYGKDGNSLIGILKKGHALHEAEFSDDPFGDFVKRSEFGDA